MPDQAALRRAYELPSDAAVRKQMTELTEQTRQLIACSSLVLIASVDAQGNCDVSRAAARRVRRRPGRANGGDTGRDREQAPGHPGERHRHRAGRAAVRHPGRTTTLRVNGRACVSTRPELLSQLTAVGKPPASALVLGIEEVYPHCPKALLRGGAWKPEQWLPADASRPRPR
ncbi:pyridoxamine 5'-phosphate oxidase [Micromonospora sp. M12]